MNNSKYQGNISAFLTNREIQVLRAVVFNFTGMGGALCLPGRLL
ncbi:MAG: hypothetical protein OXE92_08510 [Bacteroidetes bacterium]|nr:hypothetical protein [Bacteroidota bacterium]